MWFFLNLQKRVCIHLLFFSKTEGWPFLFYRGSQSAGNAIVVWKVQFLGWWVELQGFVKMVDCAFATIFVIKFNTIVLDLIVKVNVPIIATVVTFELIQNMSFFLVGRRWALAHYLDLLLLFFRKWWSCYRCIGPPLTITEVTFLSLTHNIILTTKTQIFR